ncbi:ladderlectin-like [Centroberyx gerrardi]
MMLIVSILLCATLALKGNAAADVSGSDQKVDANQNQGADKSDVGESCALGWSPYGSRCFIFNSNPLNWVQAEQHCLALGANLASVHSLEEYEFIQEMVKGSSGGLPVTWIGGSDNAQNRTWFWSDGSSFDYQYWASGEPNNYGGRQPCIQMDFGERLMSEQVEVQCHMAVAGLHVISVAAP